MLNSDIDYRTIIGYANYRFMINCTQSKLAKLLEVNPTVLSKALKELEKQGLIKHDKENERLFYVNPFLFNTHRIFDIRTLNAFKDEWGWKDKNNSNGEVIRKHITPEAKEKSMQNGGF